MKFNKEDLALVVKKVLTYYLGRQNTRNPNGRSLAIISEFPIGFDGFFSEFELSGETATTDFFTAAPQLTYPAGAGVFTKGNKTEELNLLNRLATYEKLDILTPSLSFLRALRDGDESDVFARVTLWFLMTDRQVMARVPYGLGDLPSGTFGKQVRTLLDDLSDMGITFAGLTPGFEEMLKQLDGYETDKLISEETVRQYAKVGVKQITAPKGTVITPLARETAKEIGVAINE